MYEMIEYGIFVCENIVQKEGDHAMDSYSGITGDPLPLMGVPFGISSALAENEAVGSGFAGLSETDKEHLILRCKDARSKEEVEKSLDSVAPDAGVAMLAEEESTVYGPLENTGAF